MDSDSNGFKIWWTWRQKDSSFGGLGLDMNILERHWESIRVTVPMDLDSMVVGLAFTRVLQLLYSLQPCIPAVFVNVVLHHKTYHDSNKIKKLIENKKMTLP